MSKVRRIYVEKKDAYAVKAKDLKKQFKDYLGIKADNVRVLTRYDMEGVSEDTYNKAKVTIFSEPPIDVVYEESFPMNEKEKCFSQEYLPGQFDQRADSAEQCVKLLNEEETPVIKTATTYVVEGDVTEEQMQTIREYVVNPVDSRITDETKPETLVTNFEEPADVKIFDGFKDMPEAELKALYDSLAPVMEFIKDFTHRTFNEIASGNRNLCLIILFYILKWSQIPVETLIITISSVQIKQFRSSKYKLVAITRVILSNHITII